MAIPAGAVDVVSTQQLHHVGAGLASVPAVAVDVEADAMHHFRARLCWVQLGTTDDVFLVDTLSANVSPAPLAQVFGDPKVTKFFHAAGGDVQYLAEVGLRVKGLFDTHRAATLLGWPKVGLADLVLQRCGVNLAKEHQQSDFSLRPLPPELRAYIADDVRYLVEVGNWVREACQAADILEEVELDCARIADEAAERPDVATAYRFKLPTQGQSPSTQRLMRASAAALHALRLELAAAEDVPMGRMLSNAAIVAIATRQPSATKDFSRLDGVRGAFVRAHGDRVLQLLSALRAQNESGTLVDDTPPKENDSRRRRRAEALIAWRKGVAEARKVTPSVVLPNGLVDDLAALNPTDAAQLREVPYFGAKRFKLYAEAIVAAMAPYR